VGGAAAETESPSVRGCTPDRGASAISQSLAQQLKAAGLSGLKKAGRAGRKPQGVTWWNFYFQVMEFLCRLLRHIPGKLLLVWDGLRGHQGRLIVCVRGNTPNLCPKTFGELSHYARKALRCMRRRPTLVAAFWQQANLFH
jgi:hypothetical protein